MHDHRIDYPPVRMDGWTYRQSLAVCPCGWRSRFGWLRAYQEGIEHLRAYKRGYAQTYPRQYWEGKRT